MASAVTRSSRSLLRSLGSSSSTTTSGPALGQPPAKEDRKSKETKETAAVGPHLRCPA